MFGFLRTIGNWIKRKLAPAPAAAKVPAVEPTRPEPAPIAPAPKIEEPVVEIVAQPLPEMKKARVEEVISRVVEEPKVVEPAVVPPVEEKPVPAEIVRAEEPKKEVVPVEVAAKIEEPKAAEPAVVSPVEEKPVPAEIVRAEEPKKEVAPVEVAAKIEEPVSVPEPLVVEPDAEPLRQVELPPVEKPTPPVVEAPQLILAPVIALPMEEKWTASEILHAAQPLVPEEPAAKEVAAPDALLPKPQEPVAEPEPVAASTPEPASPVVEKAPAISITPFPARFRPSRAAALAALAPEPVEEPEPAKNIVLMPPLAPAFTGRVELTPALDNPARLRQIEGVISVHDIANRELLDLVPYEPGKPVDDVARELGLDPSSIIKLASNENPLGPSPLALAAMRDSLSSVHFYPDGGGFHLRNAIAISFGLGRENVVLGNGSNEIIELLFHTFTRPGIHEIVTARHAFAVYTLMAQLFGVHAITVDDVDFTPDLPAMLGAITPQTRLVFLASPNNPTGTRVTNEALDAFLHELPPHVILVLDEAYYEFLDNPPDTVGYVRKGLQVVLMRTFSKIQGLAGLRIGYGLAPAEIANLLQRARQPFNANSIAQAGAMAGLADKDHQQKTKAITDEGRRVIESAFARMGLKYIPSSANFVLVHVGDGGEVFKRLMKKGIIVRSMVSYHLPEYIRVSVGTPEQNARFLAELPGALEGLITISENGDAPERPVVHFVSSTDPHTETAPENPSMLSVDSEGSDEPKTHPISPADPAPDVAPERVPTPDPTPNPEREPEETDPEPEPESEPLPEPANASAQP